MIVSEEGELFLVEERRGERVDPKMVDSPSVTTGVTLPELLALPELDVEEYSVLPKASLIKDGKGKCEWRRFRT